MVASERIEESFLIEHVPSSKVQKGFIDMLAVNDRKRPQLSLFIIGRPFKTHLSENSSWILMAGKVRPTLTMTEPGGSKVISFSPIRPSVSGVSGRQMKSILGCWIGQPIDLNPEAQSQARGFGRAGSWAGV